MFVEKLEKEDFIAFIKNDTFTGDNNIQIVYDFDNLSLEKKSGKVIITIPNKVYLNSNRILNHCHRAPDLGKTEIENIAGLIYKNRENNIISNPIKPITKMDNIANMSLKGINFKWKIKSVS